MATEQQEATSWWGRSPRVLLASGQSKSQLRKTRMAFSSALIRLTCKCSHKKKNHPSLPWAGCVLCQAHEILPEIKACARCAARARNVTCSWLDQRGHRRGDGGQGHPAPGRGLVLQGHAGDERAHGVTHVRGM